MTLSMLPTHSIKNCSRFIREKKKFWGERKEKVLGKIDIRNHRAPLSHLMITSI